uniref:Ephrin RBD domain-containing protein n=1 Tax=Romanomermis culicivorax TaxID=13658 RepID=A0A915JL61_ROMCU
LRFRADTTDHVINVNIRDQLNIRCPVYNKSVLNDEHHFEYSEIYSVPKWSYDNCVLTSEAKIVGVCRNSVIVPESIITVVFREFTPLPSGLEFTPGKSYYFITTSDGSQAGLSNRKGGLCSTKNMKLKFIVHHQIQSKNLHI